MFAGENVVAEGRILDLSLPGCLMESSKKMSAGEYIQLRLFLPDYQAPLHIALAAIRWAEGSKVGIEFIRTSQPEQHRLEQFVRRSSGYDGSSTLSDRGVLAGIKWDEKQS
ncbi:MAG: PilZ domain-containing protein [Nitrospira sp.]|nr:PilZ domain-containing protein [Nitrospira sp.]